MAYCVWLRDKTGLPFRLPTQAEWEYAYNAGQVQDSAANSPLRDRAWYSANLTRPDRGYPQAHPVGLKRPNHMGLYDMLGNVWEWCLDGPTVDHAQSLAAFEQMSPQLRVNSFLLELSKLVALSSELFDGTRAMRGGSYEDPAERVDHIWRMIYAHNYPAYRVGFRVAYSARQVSAPASRKAASMGKQDASGVNGTPAAHDSVASPIVGSPGSAKEERALLLTQYRKVLGDRMERFPVLKWRDELIAMGEDYSRALPDRKRDGQMRDALSPELRKEFFRLRDLCAFASMADYKGDEMELLLAFVPEMTAEHSASREATGSCLSKMRERIDRNAGLLTELSQTTKLPTALVKRAQIEVLPKNWTSG